MKVRPLADRILAKRIEQKEQKRGTLVIPDSAREKPMEGKVLAVGSGKHDKEGNRIPLTVKVGDRILFGKHAGTDVKIDDEDQVVLREDEVLGILS